MLRKSAQEDIQKESKEEKNEVQFFLQQSSAYKALLDFRQDEYWRKTINDLDYIVLDENFVVWKKVGEADAFSDLLKLTTQFNFSFLQISFLRTEKSQVNTSSSSNVFQSNAQIKSPIGQLNIFREEILQKINEREYKLAQIAGETYKPPMN